jgi:hypothetical protein
MSIVTMPDKPRAAARRSLRSAGGRSDGRPASVDQVLVMMSVSRADAVLREQFEQLVDDLDVQLGGDQHAGGARPDADRAQPRPGAEDQEGLQWW